MTRTERSISPRAIMRDRSSRTGFDKRVPKDGAGTHNWGALSDEREHEDAAYEDEEHETDKVNMATKSTSPPKTATITEEELAQAKKVRVAAAKGQGIDLVAIARSSAAVASPGANTKA
ncbi:hypothetical protein FISHEDRAFT_78956 [Fistulina hepatica ATCC 64428]|uniref:Hyaluronan/mRNA-binding protein domain-containing protein n=1 Tax=Fistulina hepatica ATCC 64428 TaxID=1128425 RepID=A0A0D6ZZQ7_9AGAR|nr:hypothetical protein FISHEDRAFT_78956 [Fistulina hepatica ATCC 64428]